MMNIDQVGQTVLQPPVPQVDGKSSPVIDSNEIKAILYLGIRGKISLPVNDHKVDVFA